MVTFLGDHGANQGSQVHDFGGLRKGVRDLQTFERGIDRDGRSTDRAIGMRVERLELARSALHPQNDHRLGSTRWLGVVF